MKNIKVVRPGQPIDATDKEYLEMGKITQDIGTLCLLCCSDTPVYFGGFRPNPLLKSIFNLGPHDDMIGIALCKRCASYDGLEEMIGERLVNLMAVWN